MLSQNIDLYLIRHALDQLCQVVDRLIEHDSCISDIQKKNVIRDSRINELEERCEEMMQMLHNQQTQIQSQQTQLVECQESTDYAVKEVRHLTHLVDEKEELENLLAFYCPPD
jgi:chromosome segregation ATPase